MLRLIAEPETPLYQRPDHRWECWSVKPGGSVLGYCLPDAMVRNIAKGHPLEGLSWAEVQGDAFLATGLAYAKVTEAEWERGRKLRILNRKEFHWDGHRTEQEAIQCYQRFLREFGEREI